jgi:hypothetical protein
MRIRLLTYNLAVTIVGGAMSLHAQEPQQTQPQSGNANQAITITGCVKPETDVPGRKPNVVERAGVTEDYILTNVKMAPGSAVSGIGLSPMYEIEGIAGAELKKHINHQVELTGVIAADRRMDDDAPDFTAVTMKMISATCPAEK